MPTIVRIEIAPEYKAQEVADTLVAGLKTARVTSALDKVWRGTGAGEVSVTVTDATEADLLVQLARGDQRVRKATRSTFVAKPPAQLDREIAEAAAEPPAKPKKVSPRKKSPAKAKKPRGLMTVLGGYVLDMDRGGAVVGFQDSSGEVHLSSEERKRRLGED
jgi:hypothetical protein